ncbi:MAG: nucleotidyltransferase domain-containing protein [Coriobacteriia bacterium]
MSETSVAEIEGLQQAIDVLVAGFDPLRIILFGSHARGDASTSSDIDLLVVLPKMGHKRHTMGAMLDALASLPVVVDPVPTDPAEIERRGDLAGDVLRPALREGRVVYERAA